MMKSLHSLKGIKPLVRIITMALSVGAVGNAYGLDGDVTIKGSITYYSSLLDRENAPDTTYISMAIGSNSNVEIINTGTQEKIAFKELTPAGGLVLGYKTYARTSSLNVGNKPYAGTMGGVPANAMQQSKVLNITSLGSNTFALGAFASVLGSYQMVSSEYKGGWSGPSAHNVVSTTAGTLNNLYSYQKKNYSGVANSMIGIANVQEEANGSLVFGSGNKVKNSFTSIGTPAFYGNVEESLAAFTQLVKDSDGAGSTMAFGGGNIAQKTLRTSVIGVNNTIESAMRMNTVLKCPDDTDWEFFNKDKCFASSDLGERSPRDPVYVQEKADYAITNNFVSGVSNQITGVNNSVFLGSNNNISMADNITLLGDNRIVQGTTDAPISHVIAIGSVDANTATDTPVPNDSKKITTSGAVAIGHNAYVDSTSVGENAQGAAVALGENSVARTAAGQVGYDAKTGTTYTPEVTTTALTAANAAAPATPDATWKATADAITVGDVQYTNSELTNAGTAITRQITGVAAGKEDIDMVNVAQIKRVKDTLSQKADAAKVVVKKGNDNIVVTPDNIDTPSRYTVGLAPDVHVQSLTVGEGKEVVITTDGTINLGQGKTIVNDQGIMVSDGPQMTAAGIASNNTIISNAANGVVDSDAATVGQLNTINRDIAETQKTTLQLQRSARKMRNELRGIGANIGAAMALPQAILPGKAMIAAAVGTYRDESALAVGWSRASEKGKYLFKISGSINTNNDTGVSVGFGVRYN